MTGSAGRGGAGKRVRRVIFMVSRRATPVKRGSGCGCGGGAGRYRPALDPNGGRATDRAARRSLSLGRYMARRMLLGAVVALAVCGAAAGPPGEGRGPVAGGPAAAWVILHTAYEALAGTLTMPLGTARLSDM